MIGRPRQGGCRNEQKSLGSRGLCETVELFRRDVAGNLGMFPRRLQILADRQEVNVGGAKVVHDLEDLFALLSKAHHDSRLRKDLRIYFLGLLQKPEGMEVAGAWTN